MAEVLRLSQIISSPSHQQQTSLRLHKMIFNVRRYDVGIRYIPGCKQGLADTLRRASVNNDDSGAYEEF